MPAKSVDDVVTPAMLHILLALAEEDLHGYGIMRAIEERTDGTVEIGPGTLYRSIKYMLAAGMIEELSTGEAERGRRVYRLTRAGRKVATREAQRLTTIVDWAVKARILTRGARS